MTTEVDWLISPVLPRGKTVTFDGEVKTGKTELALALALALATGKECMDSPAREPIDVIYLHFDGRANGLPQLLTHLGYEVNQDLSRFHYSAGFDCPPMDNRGNVIRYLVDQYNAKAVFLDRPLWVSVDTKGSFKDEDFSGWTATIKQLKEEGVTIVFIDAG